MKTGLYIHIPFCKSKCLYCDFRSFANRDEYIGPYFSALKKELRYWGEKEKDRVLDTVYFGGGTPSYVDAKLISEVIKEVKTIFNIQPDSEITVECNPGTIGFQDFKLLKEAGANRLSLGLQSTDNSMLRAIGRIHTLEDFERCFLDARRAGFFNISIDLMYGLPGMNLEDWEQTLQKALSFDAEHISVYALKVEEGTPFSKMKLALPNDDLTADMYELAVETLRNNGYKRYEVSNFAKKGCESRHNQKYWRLDDYLGVGLGAHSFMDSERFFNISEMEEYISAAESGGTLVEERTPVTLNEQMSEFVFLGLRCEDGISLREFKKRFGVSITDVFGAPIKKYTDWGFLVSDGERLKFSDKGFFVSNLILADFV